MNDAGCNQLKGKEYFISFIQFTSVFIYFHRKVDFGFALYSHSVV